LETGWVALFAALTLLATSARALDRTKGAPPQNGGDWLTIDEPGLIAAGIRKLEGQRLTLYTDLPSSPEVDALCRVFDAAFPQWCQYFGVAPENQVWHMRGFLIGDRDRFRALGLLPPWLPPFSNGFSVGDVLWLYDQPSGYYRRHLLLHEGTHGFVRAFFADNAPPWYNEGLAELLGTHHWDGQNLRLAYNPQSPDEVPMWGRVKIVQDAVQAGQGLTLEQVLAFGPTAHREIGPYGWCWALTVLLDGDPRFRDRFRALPRYLNRPDFTQQFQHLFAADWRLLQMEWLLFTHNIEYGYSFQAEALDLRPGVPLPPAGAAYPVAAHRGWQNTGYRLEAGKSYLFTAQGRYTIAHDGGEWVCEPNGATIRYHRGKPLGIVLAAVVGHDSLPDSPGGLLHPAVLGSSIVWSPPTSGTLFLRINDSPAELGDNSGMANVFIRPRE